MAKGRRLTNSRSERLLGSGNYNNYGHEPYNGDMSEFAEEDVWSTDHGPNYQESNYENNYESTWTPRTGTESGRRRDVTSQSKAVPVEGLSLAFEDETMSPRRMVHQFAGANHNVTGGGNERHVATSAPVNVPDWSKILHPAQSIHDSYEDDDPGDDSGMEPPHEYLARSRKVNAFSVYEGVGRTLKGRDMSRIRDAVWSQTGFEG